MSNSIHGGDVFVYPVLVAKFFSNILACPLMAQPCVVISTIGKRNRDPDEMKELHEKIGMVIQPIGNQPESLRYLSFPFHFAL
jgi:hypothetical protein